MFGGKLTAIILLTFFLLIPINTDAEIFDEILDAGITPVLDNTIADADFLSNAITYDNKVEIVYRSSTGLKNLVMTNESGGWTYNTYTVTNDIITSNRNNMRFSLMQNSDEVELFTFGSASKGEQYEMHQYRKQKDSTSWSFIRNPFNITATIYRDEFDCIFYDEETIYCAVIDHPNVFRLYRIYNDNGSVTQTYSKSLDFHKEDFPIYIRKSLYDGDIYYSGGDMAIGDGAESNYRMGILRAYAPNFMSAKYGKIKYDVYEGAGIGASMGSTIIPSPKKDYTAVYLYGRHLQAVGGNPPTNEVWFVFDTNSTLGINCDINTGEDGNFYYCNDTLGNASYSPVYPEVYWNYMPSDIDRKNNIHIINFAINDYKTISHTFQNNADTKWYSYVITSFSNLDAMAFTLYGDGSIFFKTGSSLQVYIEQESLKLIGAGFPSTITDNSALGYICGAGSYLTGTTLEGGCLVVALFVLAISISVIGLTFHYYEHSYGKEISNKYLITGGSSIIIIILMTIAGMSDLFTSIISSIIIIAVMMAYKDRFVTGGR